MGDKKWDDKNWDDKKWEVTFSDMLTLLLTFFVFIIAVSSFQTTEYKKFWETYREPEKKTPTKSFKVTPIQGLKIPKLSKDAEKLLNELEETFLNSDFQGVDVNYNENKISLMVSEELTFDGGRFDLKDEAKPVLTGLIPAMQASKFNVGVEGHTDALTSDKIDNTRLSLDRALNVARFLIAAGLDKEKISVSGYGPHRPIADNASLEGRKRNRRVEINIIINSD